MKKLAIFIGVLILSFLAACSNRTTIQPGTLTPGPKSGIAEIVAIEILPVSQGEPTQRVLIQGKVPSSCAQLDEMIAERVDNIFSLKAPYSQTSIQDCNSGSVAFDKVINLDIANLDPGIYTVIGGNISATFTIAESIAAARLKELYAVL